MAERRDEEKGIRFNRELNIGHLLMTVSFVASLLAALITSVTHLNKMQSTIDVMSTRLEAQANAIIALQIEQREQRQFQQEIRQALGRLEGAMGLRPYKSGSSNP